MGEQCGCKQIGFGTICIVAALLTVSVIPAAASGRTDSTLSPTASTQTELIAIPLYERSSSQSMDKKWRCHTGPADF
jgi:hypothetical protein